MTSIQLRASLPQIPDYTKQYSESALSHDHLKIGTGDVKGLRQLDQQIGKPFVTGIVLYNGDLVLPFGDKLWAVPLHQLERLARPSVAVALHQQG